MFKSKTVFVVGAGASAEVELPIGRELTEKISKLLDIHTEFGQIKKGDYQIYEALRTLVNRYPDEWQGNNLIGSARHISEAMGMATSIDTFLETFATDRERVLLGKLGIAKAILAAERGSRLAPSREGQAFKVKDVTDTWYVSLAQLLFSSVAIEHVHRALENVSFIVFNYDRCLQLFLVQAFKTYFNIDAVEATRIVEKATFLHPYGSLGSIFATGSEQVPFGAESCNVLKVAESINTFSESVADVETLAAVREEIRRAQTIVFLGFGFHGQNMDVLSEPVPKAQKITATRRVLATVKGLSKSDTAVVRSQIGLTLKGRPPKVDDDYSIDTFDGKCSELFGEYWRSLTAA